MPAFEAVVESVVDDKEDAAGGRVEDIDAASIKRDAVLDEDADTILDMIGVSIKVVVVGDGDDDDDDDDGDGDGDGDGDELSDKEGERLISAIRAARRGDFKEAASQVQRTSITESVSLEKSLSKERMSSTSKQPVHCMIISSV